ncbi:hypothetical protein PISMIDRAFT_687312 [Pisolithus microcarpus 441]|uniref:Uncharacterized protein n=1 Tax=Pisolithus microcarpus 441 TaxID=765257 RepID=A0A0C9YZ22_9AGAM|nr:hypothetical protein BKA83DRAFT_687312 [Pisolithus microcarpus]KIK15392.1 hypothetical protein PISMIDRAFT_687312 [Pisolithus microcarpus 441]
MASASPGRSLVTRLSARSTPPLMGFETKQSYRAKASGTTHRTSRIKKKKETAAEKTEGFAGSRAPYATAGSATFCPVSEPPS